MPTSTQPAAIMQPACDIGLRLEDILRRTDIELHVTNPEFVHEDYIKNADGTVTSIAGLAFEACTFMVEGTQCFRILSEDLNFGIEEGYITSFQKLDETQSAPLIHPNMNTVLQSLERYVVLVENGKFYRNPLKSLKDRLVRKHKPAKYFDDDDVIMKMRALYESKAKKVKLPGADLRARLSLRDMISEADYKRFVVRKFVGFQGVRGYYVIPYFGTVKVRTPDKKLFSICIHSDKDVPKEDHLVNILQLLHIDENLVWSLGNVSEVKERRPRRWNSATG